jgi:hypothetical protein
MEKANDGIIDCIGAADEPKLCRAIENINSYQSFYCENHNSLPCLDAHLLCDTQSDCINNEDEQICTSDDINMYYEFDSICTISYEFFGSDAAKTLCRRFFPRETRLERDYFTLAEIQSSLKSNVIYRNNDIFPRQHIINIVQHYQQRCHRGLHLQVWLNKEKNITTSTCLCPPSFYGDICQFQNERVSITMRCRVTVDTVQTPLAIIISLIDNSEERIIHSYEQFTYVQTHHCDTKLHVYLLYSTRPKNPTKNYSVHIDVYEKISLNYRGSIIKPLLYPFLPIQRLSFILNIPFIDENTDSCSDRQCINGKCRRYFNDINNTTFCQCNSGWSGQNCTIQHTCMCSSDSLCIGKLANNRSLCVCPLNKIGARCLLNNTVCKVNQCLNGGQCIVIDEFRTHYKHLVCKCLKGFTGDRCQINQTKIIVSFQKNIIVPNSIRIHFIQVIPNQLGKRESIYKTIPFGQDSITIYWSFPFNIVFIEWNKNY